MARNSIPEGAERTPIHIGEHLLTPGYGAEIQLKIPATIEGPKSSHTSRGRVWLTDQRVSVAAGTVSHNCSALYLCGVSRYMSRQGVRRRMLQAHSRSFSSATSPEMMTTFLVSTTTRNSTRSSSPTYVSIYRQTDLTLQSTIRDNAFNVPLFSANNILISFVPDVTHRCPNLPDPGIGQYLTCKMLVDNGFGHNLWKRIEKERAAWVERNRAAEALRKSASRRGCSRPRTSHLARIAFDRPVGRSAEQDIADKRSRIHPARHMTLAFPSEEMLDLYISVGRVHSATLPCSARATSPMLLYTDMLYMQIVFNTHTPSSYTLS